MAVDVTCKRPASGLDGDQDTDAFSREVRELWKLTGASCVVSGLLALFVVFVGYTYRAPDRSRDQGGVFHDWIREAAADAAVATTAAAALLALVTVLSVAVVLDDKGERTPMDLARSGVLSDLSAYATFGAAIVAWLGVAATSMHLPQTLLPLVLFFAAIPVSSGLWTLHGPDQRRLRQSIHHAESRLRAAGNALARRRAQRDALRWRSSFPWHLVSITAAGYLAAAIGVTWFAAGRPAWKGAVEITVVCTVWSCFVVQWSANLKMSKEINGKVPFVDWNPLIPALVVIPVLVSFGLFGTGRTVAGGLVALAAIWPVLPAWLDDRRGQSELVAFCLQRRRARLRAALVNQRRQEHLMGQSAADPQRRSTGLPIKRIVAGVVLILLLLAARGYRPSAPDCGSPP